MPKQAQITRLTTRGRFAVTAMIDLVMNAQTGTVKLSAISERQSISLSYLEQLFSKLRHAQLVESLCGPGGGYIFTAPASEVNIIQIIATAEDRLDVTRCGSKANYHHGAPRLTHNLWKNLNKTISDYLSSVTLQNIIEQKNCNDGSQVVTFTHIH